MANVKFTDLANLGNITANTIVPVVESNTNYTVTAANLQAYVNSTTGNITAGNILANTDIQALANVTAFYFLGNGSQLTGIVSSYGNSNVAAYLPTYTGNITAGTISATGNVTGNYFIGNGSQLTGLPATYGNAEVAAYLPTYTGNLNPNTVSATGNVTGAFLLGNISGATGGYGNANVQAVLQSYSGTMTAGSLSATGNITGNFFIGNGSQLTGITASLSGNMTGNINGNGFSLTNALNITATGNVTGTHRGDGANLTGIPTSIIAGSGISVSAATGAVTITNNNPTPYANANVAAYLPTYSGAITASSVSATGNVTGANITGTHFGNGATLSNIVTSIIAGTGISINQSTGAVTITNTGGGGSGNAISNGTSNVSIATANGPVRIYTNGFTGAQAYFDDGVISNGNLNLVSGSSGSMNLNGISIAYGAGVVNMGSKLINGVGGITISGTGGITQSSASASSINAGVGGFQANQRTVAQGTTGTAGQIFWDANYIYVCTAANTWKRAALTTY